MAVAATRQQKEVAVANDPTHQFVVQKLVPIELGGVDFSFTNASLFMVATVAVASAFLYFASASRSLIPTRAQSLAEMSYESLPACCAKAPAATA